MHIYPLLTFKSTIRVLFEHFFYNVSDIICKEFFDPLVPIRKFEKNQNIYSFYRKPTVSLNLIFPR